MNKLEFFRKPDDHSLDHQGAVRRIISACFSEGYYISPETAKWVSYKLDGVSMSASDREIVDAVSANCMTDRIVNRGRS